MHTSIIRTMLVMSIVIAPLCIAAPAMAVAQYGGPTITLTQNGSMEPFTGGDPATFFNVYVSDANGDLLIEGTPDTIEVFGSSDRGCTYPTRSSVVCYTGRWTRLLVGAQISHATMATSGTITATTSLGTAVATITITHPPLSPIPPEPADPGITMAYRMYLPITLQYADRVAIPADTPPEALLMTQGDMPEFAIANTTVFTDSVGAYREFLGRQNQDIVIFVARETIRVYPSAEDAERALQDRAARTLALPGAFPYYDATFLADGWGDSRKLLVHHGTWLGVFVTEYVMMTRMDNRTITLAVTGEWRDMDVPVGLLYLGRALALFYVS